MPKFKVTRWQQQGDTVEIEIDQETFDEYLADPYIGVDEYRREMDLEEFVLTKVDNEIKEWQWTGLNGSSTEYEIEKIK